MSEKEIESRIRILAYDNDGTIIDTRGDYDLEDFGGILPSVGDLIVDPLVQADLDRREPENRHLLEVKQRYFQPRTGPEEEHVYCHLVVLTRQATNLERLVACRS